MNIDHIDIFGMKPDSPPLLLQTDSISLLPTTSFWPSDFVVGTLRTPMIGQSIWHMGVGRAASRYVLSCRNRQTQIDRCLP